MPNRIEYDYHKKARTFYFKEEKTMKKRTALMLALLMCCLAFLVSCDLEELLATAQKTTETTNQNTTSPLPESQALEYKVNEGGDSCTVTGIGTYKGTILDIPSQINGYTVACIGADAFANCSQIVSLFPAKHHHNYRKQRL